jgi:hypothetical protein
VVKLIIFLAALLTMTGGSIRMARANDAFPFKSYERRFAKDTDIAGATHDIKTRLPIGSPVSEYVKLFNDVGGKCSTLTDPKYPNTVLCNYSHGFLVQSEWVCVLKFDPITNNVTDVTLNFYLTGM